MSDRGVPRPIPVAADRPINDGVLAQLRARVQTRYYDRPDVIDALARAIVAHADGLG